MGLCLALAMVWVGGCVPRLAPAVPAGPDPGAGPLPAGGLPRPDFEPTRVAYVIQPFTVEQSSGDGARGLSVHAAGGTHPGLAGQRPQDRPPGGGGPGGDGHSTLTSAAPPSGGSTGKITAHLVVSGAITRGTETTVCLPGPPQPELSGETGPAGPQGERKFCWAHAARTLAGHLLNECCFTGCRPKANRISPKTRTMRRGRSLESVKQLDQAAVGAGFPAFVLHGQDVDLVRLFRLQIHLDLVRQVIADLRDLQGAGLVRNEAHLGLEVVPRRPPEPDNVAGLNFDERLGHSLEDEDHQGAVRVIEPHPGFFFELVHHRVRFDGEGDSPLGSGGDAAVVVHHGAGAVRVHLLDLKRLAALVVDGEGVGQGLVFHHFAEIMDGLRHGDPRRPAGRQPGGCRPPLIIPGPPRAPKTKPWPAKIAAGAAAAPASGSTAA